MNYKQALKYAVIPGEILTWGITLLGRTLSIYQYVGIFLMSLVMVMLLAGVIESSYYM